MSTLRSIVAGIVVPLSLSLAGCGGGGGDAAVTSDATGSQGSTSGTSVMHAPTISGTPSTSVVVGGGYSFQPTAADAPGNTLTFSATGLPSWVSINSQTGLVSGSPAASNVGTSSNISITVSDGMVSANLAAFTITVTAAAGNGQATVSWTAPTTNSDGSALTNLSGYEVVYGQSASSLDQSMSITDPTATSATITNLTSGTWYFGVRATTSSTESDVSSVASKTI